MAYCLVLYRLCEKIFSNQMKTPRNIYYFMNRDCHTKLS